MFTKTVWLVFKYNAAIWKVIYWTSAFWKQSSDICLEEVQGSATSSLFTPPLFQNTWPCVQLLRAERNAPCQRDLAIDKAEPPALVAQLDAPSDWRPGGCGFNPRRGRQHSFVEIDHEIFSTVILSLPLIQEGQLSVSGERMCTILVNRLED